MIMMKTECPFCARKRQRSVSTIIPRQVFDCTCGASVEVRPVRAIKGGHVWAVHWTPCDHEDNASRFVRGRK